jgi:hypothetical protein
MKKATELRAGTWQTYRKDSLLDLREKQKLLLPTFFCYFFKEVQYHYNLDI